MITRPWFLSLILAVTSAALVSCADGGFGPIEPEGPNFAKGGKGKPGTGSGPNAEIAYLGSATMASSEALILTDNKRKHQTEACCGGTGERPHSLSWELIGTIAACSSNSPQLQNHLDSNGARDAYTVWSMDRRAGTGSLKIIYTVGSDGPFILTLFGEMAEAPGLVFTLSGPGSTRMDWPSGFAALHGLAEIETCGAFDDSITADVDPV